MIVYCIRNKENSKEYVGLTTRSLSDRWKQHIRESNKENSWEWNTPLGNAIKKYGKDAFEVFIIAECISVDSMKQKEIELIESRKSLVQFGGYNISKGGDGRLGVKLSEETKKKIGLGNLGKIYTNEVRKKMSDLAKERCIGKPSPMDGKKHSDEAKKKISQASKGRKQSEEHKRNRIEAYKRTCVLKKLNQLQSMEPTHE